MPLNLNAEMKCSISIFPRILCVRFYYYFRHRGRDHNISYNHYSAKSVKVTKLSLDAINMSEKVNIAG